MLEQIGLKRSDFWIGAVKPEDIPVYLRQARIGLSFRKPTFSQIAASPTKIPEYLAAGLPVVCNAGIGDMDDLLEKTGVGVIVRTFDSGDYARAADRALVFADDPGMQARCIEVARQHFDLEQVGREGYCRVYRRIEEMISADASISHAAT